MLIFYLIQLFTAKLEKIFEGLSEEEKLIYNDLKGPSWSQKDKCIQYRKRREQNRIRKSNK